MAAIGNKYVYRLDVTMDDAFRRARHRGLLQLLCRDRAVFPSRAACLEPDASDLAGEALHHNEELAFVLTDFVNCAGMFGRSN